MKRILLAALLALCVLFSLPSRPTKAQQTEQKKLAPLEWEKLRDGVQMLRVWQLEDPKAYPQISVLRVSNAEYLKFFQDPQGFVKFVNANKVFPKDVKVAGPWVTLSSYNPNNPNDDPDWVLTLVHGKLSYMVVSALPQLTQE
ncbi:MAG: hypothetical protein WBB89_09350 [Candidatus Acidiferrum sp.]